MEATAAGLTTGTLGAFTVVHGAATQIALTDSGSTASGANHTLTATIQDAAGNTVTGDSSSVITFGKTGGDGHRDGSREHDRRRTASRRGSSSTPPPARSTSTPSVPASPRARRAT